MDEPQNEQGPDESAPEAKENQPQGEGGTQEQTGPADAGAPPPPPPGAGEGAAAPPLPPELQAASASKEDRTNAMLCHLLALAGLVFPFGNILGPLIMWLVKRETSRFVDFHGRQSLWFQVWVSIAATVLGIVFGIGTFITAGACMCFAIPVLGGIGLASMIYAVVGAVQTSGGKDFEYVWVGPWVRQSMM